MKRRGKSFFNNIAGPIVLIITLSVVIPFCQAADGQPDGQLAVTGLANGNLVVAWNQPVVTQPTGEKSAFPVDAYVLNFTFANAFNVSNTTSVRVNANPTNSYVIPSAFLGADYRFELSCVSNNVFTRCGSLNITAYPSCPRGLSQQRIQCYYLSVTKTSFPSLQRQCQSLLPPANGSNTPASSSVTDFSNMVTQDIQSKNQSLLWVATDDCLYAAGDQTNNSKCCIALRPNTTAGTTESTAKKFSQLSFSSYDISCPGPTVEMPFICGLDTPAITPKPENVTYSAFANNSVRVSWQERPVGWSLVWRTITVRDFIDQTLLQTIVVPNVQASVVLAPLVANRTYAIQIWPHLDGTLWNNTAYSEFVLLAPRSSGETNGGVMRHPIAFDASTLYYSGSLRLTWEAATAQKENTMAFTADSYQIYYGLITVNNSALKQVNVTGNIYLIPQIDAGTTYKFFIKCVFGTNIFVCGRILSYTTATPLKARTDVDKAVVYEVPTFNFYSSWADAETRCRSKDGHLFSAASTAEEAYLSVVIRGNVSYWIGANNCTNTPNGNPTWVDGTPWNFTRLNNTMTNSSLCCISAIFNTAGGPARWSYASCDTQNLFTCEYVIADLGLVKNATVTPISSTAANVTWITQNRLWGVLATDVIYKNKNTSKTSGAKATSGNTQLVLTKLTPNSEYEVNVSSYVAIFNQMVKATLTFVTGPPLSVAANVSASGQINLQWPDSGRPSNSQSSVVYVIQPTDTAAAVSGQTSPTYKVVTNNSKTTIEGLQLGKSYNFTLSVMDNTTGTVYDTTVFTIKNQPSCRANEFQFEMSCYWVAANGIVWDDTEKTCLANGGDMVMVRSPAESAFLQQLAVNMGSPFWIDGQMSALRKSEDKKVMAVGNFTELPIQHADRDVVRVARDATSQCRIVTNDKTVTNGQSWAPCANQLPVMCERTLAVKVDAVSNVLLKNVSSSFIFLVWDKPKWQPFSYNVTVSPLPKSASRVKRDAATTNSSTATPTTTKAPPTIPPPVVTLMNDSVLLGNLQPSTEYTVSIVPVVKGAADAAAINGDSRTVRVVTLGPNETAPPMMQALELSAPPGPDENVTLPLVADGQLNTFRLISSILLVVLVTIALVMFVICRMFRFRDCLNHMFFAIALIIAHILILLDVNTSDQINCRAVAICIHFFFTVSFLFFALECFCHVKTMTSLVPLGLLNRPWQHFLIGWGIPILIIIISAASVPDEYLIKNRKGHCWLNLESSAMLATVIPIGIFAGLALVFLGLAICARPKDNYEVDEESYLRYDAMQDIRWMLLFILALLISHWSMGMIAVHTEDGNYYIGFIVLTIILGIAILLLRCIGDDEVRLRLKKCCQGTPIEPGENEIGSCRKSQDKMKILRSGNKDGKKGGDKGDNTVTLMSCNYPKQDLPVKHVYSTSVWKLQN